MTVGIDAQSLQRELMPDCGHGGRCAGTTCRDISSMEPASQAVHPHEDGEQVARFDVRDIEVIDILDLLVDITEPYLIHPSEIEETRFIGNQVFSRLEAKDSPHEILGDFQKPVDLRGGSELNSFSFEGTTRNDLVVFFHLCIYYAERQR